MLPNKQTKLNTAIRLTVVALAVFSWPVAATAQEVYDVNFMDDPNLFAELRIPGRVEGTGTYFEVTDSDYLNITFESSEPVNLMLESVPQMVTMELEAAEGAASTQITLGGFDPDTTYYKYEDNYHNEVAFTTDENGSYSYAQDLTVQHLVFIQPNPGTIFIRDDATGGDATSIGTWDWATKTCTLTQDVYETIQIDSDGITLDGGGFSVIGTGTGYGVYLNQKSNVTITNLTVEGFYSGIHLYKNSNYNILTGNTVSNNGSYGIHLYVLCQNNTLTGNTVSNNSTGIMFYNNSNNNILTGNTFSGNSSHGIYLYYSIDNILTGNTVSNNGSYGIQLRYSSGNTLTGNTMSANQYNFYVEGTQSSDFYNDINTTNTVDGKPIYYLKDVTEPVVYDSSTNAGTFYAINCDSITIRDLTLTNNGVGVFLYNTHNSTIENVSASNSSKYGIYLNRSNYNILTGNTLLNNGIFGIGLSGSSTNTLTGNIANSNYEAIMLNGGGNNILTGNTFSGNSVYGIYLYFTSNNTLTDNIANSNKYGIYLLYSNTNILTGNIANSNNQYGIGLSGSSTNTLTGNTMSANRYNFNVTGTLSSHFDNDIDTSNTVEGKPIYYVVGASNLVYDSSTNAGTFYAINCDSITIRDLTLANNNFYGVFFRNTHNSTIENVSASNSNFGINFENSNNNILTGNTVSNNSRGINFEKSSTNTLTDNTIVLSRAIGITLHLSNTNQIYNNNFIDNVTQAYLMGDSSNVFNLDAPTGGNYWSDWTSPDNDGDGFVDSPYLFNYGVDSLPWTTPDGWLAVAPTWPEGSTLTASDVGLMGLTLTWTAAEHHVGVAEYLLFQDEVFIDNVTAEQLSYTVIGLEYFTEYAFKVEACDGQGYCSTDGPSLTVRTLTPVEAIEELVAEVLALNIQNGLSNSLDAKLDAVLRALDDANENNDVAAINALEAFINAVEAQRGNMIPEDDADSLIATAQEAIAALSGM